MPPIDLAAFLVLGVLSWGLRVACVLLVPADRLPDAVADALQHLAPAALASICAVELMAVMQHADALDAVASSAIVALDGISMG